MSLERLISQYINSAEQVLRDIEIPETSTTVETVGIKAIVDCARDYLTDAKYYREKKKLEVSLTSVAYCEGMLDALRLLGVVKFEWPKHRNDEK